MPALEDHRVPRAGAPLWRAIEEPDWRAGRDGDRPDGTSGDLVEADVPGVVDQLDHTRRLTRRRERREDRALLRLIRTWRTAGRLATDGPGGPPAPGSPPEGCLAPVLAPVSWHDAREGWCATVVKAYGRGAFRYDKEAERWSRV